MKYINVPPNAAQIVLGRRGEHLARTLVFDISDWVKTYGEGTVHLLHQRSGDAAPYPCVVEQEGSQVRWAVTNADTALAGRGKLELRYYVGEALVKSFVYLTETALSLIDETGEVPEGAKSWVDEVLTAMRSPGDWAENDPESPVYIKNRTHWAEDGRITVLPEATVSYDTGGDMYPLTTAFDLTVGESYVVVWNGTEYVCTAVETEMDEGVYVAVLGDLDFMMGSAEQSKYPFLIAEAPPEMMTTLGMYGFFANLEGTDDVTLSIAREGEVVHKLDNKYLDTEWMATSEPITVEVLAETTVNYGDKVYGLEEYLPIPATVDGESGVIRAIYDGQTYSMPYIIRLDRTDGLAATLRIGNQGVEPFWIVGYYSVGYFEVYPKNDTAEAHTLALYLDEIAYNKLPEGFLPENAARANETLASLHPVGYGSFSMNRRSQSTVGAYSFCEGRNTAASGANAHAEGNATSASGNDSHAEGLCTKATGQCQHVQGQYNIVDTTGSYAHIVGNGTNATILSNAHTLDWKGNAWYAGTVEGTALILPSSTADSTKKFKITVDDSGTITAVEV